MAVSLDSIAIFPRTLVTSTRPFSISPAYKGRSIIKPAMGQFAISSHSFQQLFFFVIDRRKILRFYISGTTVQRPLRAPSELQSRAKFLLSTWQQSGFLYSYIQARERAVLRKRSQFLEILHIYQGASENSVRPSWPAHG